MEQAVDQFTSYATVLITLLFAGLLTHASVIMTVGGLILLALRLYVDGMKAWRTYRKENDG